jgi:hypothetical protein
MGSGGRNENRNERIMNKNIIVSAPTSQNRSVYAAPPTAAQGPFFRYPSCIECTPKIGFVK